jgi:hypothetical protein
MLHEYHIIYSVRYYPRFHVTAVGLGTITHGYGGTPLHSFFGFYKILYKKFDHKSVGSGLRVSARKFIQEITYSHSNLWWCRSVVMEKTTVFLFQNFPLF